MSLSGIDGVQDEEDKQLHMEILASAGESLTRKQKRQLRKAKGKVDPINLAISFDLD